MIDELHVKNLALIKEAVLSPSPGMTVITGETGAGKTTIAKAILRILPDAQAKIAGGKIFLEGQNLLELSERAMRKELPVPEK